MLVKILGCALQGLEGITVTIEVNVSEGLRYFMVGLPDHAVRESWQRVESAIRAVGGSMPRRKIVINLAPADIRKEGSAYDLPIAIGILLASGQLRSVLPLERWMILGELSLDGSLKPIRGALPVTLHALREGFEGIILPEESARQASIVQGIRVVPARSLQEVIQYLEGGSFPVLQQDPEELLRQALEQRSFSEDLAEVRGQYLAKRALIIASAGGHNLLMIGPPGAGKSMLARRMISILPPMTIEEALETTKIYSVAGLLPEGTALITERPFRSPHHTISDVALVGGGAPPVPGEISLAHNGVLFLDELPEFKRNVLEVLRQPLESREIIISRARYTVRFPASFTLVTAMNPCPCGYLTHPEKECTCTPGMIRRYLSRVSGPLLDRIDLHVEVSPVRFEDLYDSGGTNDSEAWSSRKVREMVVACRELQQERYRGTGIYANAQLTPRLLRQYCPISEEGKKLLQKAMERFQFSARTHDRILKVARTIADLEQSEVILPRHLAEAIQYRVLDKTLPSVYL